jgi:hypothetical protein
VITESAPLATLPISPNGSHSPDLMVGVRTPRYSNARDLMRKYTASTVASPFHITSGAGIPRGNTVPSYGYSQTMPSLGPPAIRSATSAVDNPAGLSGPVRSINTGTGSLGGSGAGATSSDIGATASDIGAASSGVGASSTVAASARS